MIEQPTQWWCVEERMYVKAGDGSVWRVDGRRQADDGIALALTNAAGERAVVTQPPDHDVVVMVPTFAEAERALLAGFPGAAVERKVLRVEDIAAHPNTKAARAKIAHHLLEMHNVSISPTAHVENGDMAGLIEAHNLAHAAPQPGWTPHVHVPVHQL